MSLRTKKCNTKSHAFSFLMLPDYFRTVNVKPTSSQQRYLVDLVSNLPHLRLVFRGGKREFIILLHCR